MKSAWCLLVLLMCACNPLTFHKESVIDFTKYQRVYVILDDSDSLNRYLEEELQQRSGFREVVDAEQDADVILEVTLREVETTESDTDDTFVSVNASFTLFSSEGELIDEGEFSASSLGYDESREDVIDEVVNHYLGSYAI